MRRKRPASWVVVIASSTGGLQALRALVSRLPADLPATVLIACHTLRTSTRGLPGILSTSGPLPASYPEEGQELEPGRIFIAPPDQHLVVQQGRLHLTSEEQEHGMRPAADVLFRSVAREVGPRSIGIVLSGGGHDGAAGLAAIRNAGGRALIQACHDAKVSTMPLSALAEVKPDACASAAELGTLVAHLTSGQDRAGRGTARARAGRGRPRPRTLKGLRVFVAEDEYLIASAIISMLRELGCNVVGPVASVDAGLKVLEQERGRIDCALLDLDLQGETALPLVSVLGEQAVPLVFATGYGKAVFPKEWCAAPRIQKPYDAAALGLALRSALSMRWHPPPTCPPFDAATDYNQETLKNSRNGIMSSRVLLVSTPRSTLLRAEKALRQTTQRLIESERCKETARRVLHDRQPPKHVKASTDDGNNT